MEARVEPLKRISQRRSATERPARRMGVADGPAHAREALQAHGRVGLGAYCPLMRIRSRSTGAQASRVIERALCSRPAGRAAWPLNISRAAGA